MAELGLNGNYTDSGQRYISVESATCWRVGVLNRGEVAWCVSVWGEGMNLLDLEGGVYELTSSLAHSSSCKLLQI